ncbi:hypothetical protein NIB75_05170 [Bacteroides uniformis]|nr:hypothetical protein [Bacteroides uniformis]
MQNLITLACAYQHPQNALYHNKALKESYLKALCFWVDTNHQAKELVVSLHSLPQRALCQRSVDEPRNQ